METADEERPLLHLQSQLIDAARRRPREIIRLISSPQGDAEGVVAGPRIVRLIWKDLRLSIGEFKDFRILMQDVGSEYSRDGSVDINKQPALKHSTGNWRACFFILGVEFCVNMAYFAIARNLITFLTTVLHESKVDAARNVSAWVGASFRTPVVGAFLADTYWGQILRQLLFSFRFTLL
uniref:Uncharacterized protein n=1 Tax=Leersia perrieri TaxID=77586 RepID=A0A0D9XHA2_9ORYZ